MNPFSDTELLERLDAFEDPFVERKSQKDFRDLTKTAVAFANSLPIGVPGTIFYPVTDDRRPQPGFDLESQQKTVAKRLQVVYPPLVYTTRVLQKDGMPLLAILVFGSDQRPHFAGQAYVREGSQTVAASPQQFQRLVVERSSKAYELLKWKGKDITVKIMALPDPRAHAITGPHTQKYKATVLDCSIFWVQVVREGGAIQTFPLSRVDLSMDDDVVGGQLALEVSHSGAA